MKCAFMELFPHTSILKKIRRDIIYIYIYIYIITCCSSEAPVILVVLKSKFNPTNIFSRNIQISNSIKIRPVEGKLIHTDGQAGRR
jgi:multisubunit Na+/H+ antiporter MnhE subunit